MNWRAIITTAVCLLLVTSLLPGALAQTNTLGIGPNDVRDEPNHPDDGNGIPHTEFSPGNGEDVTNTDQLILEAYYSDRALGEFNNLVNRLVHGSSYGDYESYIVPGEGNHYAYWGWWKADTGSGGSLQEDQVTADDEHGVDGPDVALPSAPNGAIDDAWDNDAPTWDEFVWRGDNPWSPDHGFCDDDGDGETDTRCTNDNIRLFIQPGTHRANVNDATAVLSADADEGTQADYYLDDETGGSGQIWRNAHGFGLVMYDQSLLITTEVTATVNADTSGSGFNPLSGTAHDVDSYTSINPQAESLYRTTVYDPGDEVPSPTDGLVHQEGPKECAKECPLADSAVAAARPVFDAYFATINPTKTTRGNAMNQAGWSVDTHEPNTGMDDFNGHATFDADTSYGGDPFYVPGNDQDYTGYQSEEHLWVDAQQDLAVPFYGAIYGINGYPVHPSTDVDESQEDENTMAPGILNLRGHSGTWYDTNGDNWVGTVADGKYDPQNTGIHQSSLLVPRTDNWTVHQGTQTEDDPYAGGTVTDPNNYYDNPDFTTTPEWRGNCDDVDITVELTPMNPQERWGDTGVYVLQNRNGTEQGFDGLSPLDSAYDVVGEQHVTTPGEDTPDVHVYDEDGQLSKYRTHGTIEMHMFCNGYKGAEGMFRGHGQILFPTGSLDYPVKVVTTVTVGDGEIKAANGPTAGNFIVETVTDVDIIDPIVE